MSSNPEVLKKEMLANRRPVVPKCLGLEFTEEEAAHLKSSQGDRIEATTLADAPDVPLCSIYINPAAKWTAGKCPMASHFRPDLAVSKNKERVGQQKQKKKH